MIVAVAHPAAVRHVPHGARKARLAFARCVTPVALRGVAEAGLEPVRSGFLAANGRAWTGGGAAWIEDHLPAGDFVAALRGDPGARALSPHFFRTPIRGAMRGRPVTGTALDPAGSRDVLRDDRARAAAAVRDYLGRTVRLCGDRVLLRATPMARVAFGGPYGRSCSYVAHLRGVLPFDEYVALGEPLDALRRALGRDFPYDNTPAQDPDGYADRYADPGADLRTMADAVPEAIRAALARAVAAGAIADPGRAADLAAALDPLLVDAATGLAGLEAAEPTLRCSAGILADAAAACAGHEGHAGPLRRLGWAIGTVYLPAFRAPELDPGDRAALEAIAP